MSQDQACFRSIHCLKDVLNETASLQTATPLSLFHSFWLRVMWPEPRPFFPGGDCGIVTHFWNTTTTTTSLLFLFLFCFVFVFVIFPVWCKYCLLSCCPRLRHSRLSVVTFLYLYIHICIKTQDTFSFCIKKKKIIFYINIYICKQCFIQSDWIYEYILFGDLMF